MDNTLTMLPKLQQSNTLQQVLLVDILLRVARALGVDATYAEVKAELEGEDGP